MDNKKAEFFMLHGFKLSKRQEGILQSRRVPPKKQSTENIRFPFLWLTKYQRLPRNSTVDSSGIKAVVPTEKQKKAGG